MAAVFKKQCTRYLLDGKHVRKDTPGAVKRIDLSKRYYGNVRTATDRKQVPLTEQRDTSEMLLERYQREADLDRATAPIPNEPEPARPIRDHLREYQAILQFRCSDEVYQARTLRQIQKISAAAGFRTLNDITTGKVTSVLSEWGKQHGIETSNTYVRSIKGFTRWAWMESKVPADPLRNLKCRNSDTDRRRPRRALTSEELRSLIQTTLDSGKTYKGQHGNWLMTPEDRAMLYRIAAFTGLRALELASLKKSSFNFEAMTWTITAAASKSRKAVALPLALSLANELKKWFFTLDREQLFPGTWAKQRRAGYLIKQDLKLAGIPFKDEKGRRADFHALRTTFITMLARNGVHPAKAQRLARHSTVVLTLNVYTFLEIDELRDSVRDLDF